MKILTAAQIRDLDAYTIQHEPIASIDLMERAAWALVNSFVQEYPPPTTIRIFCGLGNNGGDGLCMARLLHYLHYDVSCYICRYSERTSDDFLWNEKRLERLKGSDGLWCQDILTSDDFPEIGEEDIIFDALFGSGLTRPLEGLPNALITYLNQQNCTRLAVDIPSGLMADSYMESACFKATKTYIFQGPKLSLLLPQNAPFVGAFEVVDIELSDVGLAAMTTDFHYLTLQDIVPYIKKRPKFSHKGTHGHALIMAGNHRMTGAAVLATKAALKVGAGLVTTYTPQKAVAILQNQCPEAMIWGDAAKKHLTHLPQLEKYGCIAIGPGIGQHPKTQKFVDDLLQNYDCPLVLDADALNIITANHWQNRIPKGSILTPHPKELERLTQKVSNDYEQIKILSILACEIESIILLKRAHTVIALPNGQLYFNSTGNPAMGTGGSGDVLTGMIVGLLAQGYSAKEASLLGVYFHGKAGDDAVTAMTQIVAGDLIQFMEI